MCAVPRGLIAAGAAAAAALLVAMPAAIAHHEDKPVADKLEFVEAADGIKPFGLEALEPAAAGIFVEIPEAYAWSLADKDEKEPLTQPID